MPMQGLVQAVVHEPIYQRVWVLHRGHTRQAVLVSQPHELAHAPRRFVGQADVPHLARLDQPGQRFELGVDGREFPVLRRVEINRAEHRHVADRPVNLVEVDHLSAQPRKAVVAGLHKVGRRHVAGAVAHPVHATRGAGDLGRQHHLAARAGARREPVADDPLGRAEGLAPRRHRVHFGGVDEVHPTRQRVVQDVVGRCFANLLAEGHGAQADGGHAQVAAAECDQRERVHGCSLAAPARRIL